MRTDKLREEHGVQYRWTGYPLHPATPEEGMELSELYSAGDLDLQTVQRKLAEAAAREGLPLGSRTRTYNSRKAQELGKLAEKMGLMDLYQKSVYSAYFVEGRNIALFDELIEIAKRVGLPEQEARQALKERTFSGEVEADWKRARELGVTGVPAFVCKGRILVGFPHYRDLVSLVQSW